MPIFQNKCTACHDSQAALGGWDASSYQAIMHSGIHAPVVMTGDAANSLLVQKISGNPPLMPPSGGGLLPEQIQVIIDWINAGALDN
jgi:hypothetical protein